MLVVKASRASKASIRPVEKKAVSFPRMDMTVLEACSWNILLYRVSIQPMATKPLSRYTT